MFLLLRYSTYSFKRPNVIAFLGKSYLRLGFCEGDCPRGTEYETICLPNEMAGGGEDYLGGQWTLMLFHLEIIRERERHSGTLRSGLARQYPRGIIIRVECACVPIPLGLTPVAL